MGIDDKISNQADKLVGQGKEALGKLNDDEQLEAEGKADQAEAGLRNAGEKVKDAVEDAADAVKSVFKG